MVNSILGRFDHSEFAPFDSWSHRTPGHNQLSISLVCCSFFVLDVTCNPRGITGLIITISPYVSSGPNVSTQIRKLELKFSQKW